MNADIFNLKLVTW